MLHVTLASGDTVEVREEGEAIPAEGAFVKDRAGHVLFMRLDDGVLRAEITSVCIEIEEALRNK